MSKHTEGPWKTLKFDDNENYVVTNQSGRPGFHREIATVPFGFSEPAETEQHANARLIAAAPELLEALTTMLDQMSDPSNAHHTLGAYMLGARVMVARAAIARATGAK